MASSHILKGKLYIQKLCSLLFIPSSQYCLIHCRVWLPETKILPPQDQCHQGQPHTHAVDGTPCLLERCQCAPSFSTFLDKMAWISVHSILRSHSRASCNLNSLWIPKSIICKLGNFTVHCHFQVSQWWRCWTNLGLTLIPGMPLLILLYPRKLPSILLFLSYSLNKLSNHKKIFLPNL